VKPILKGVSGVAKAGETTVIMGASGAGKTTLLNILACRIARKENTVGAASGKITANGREYKYEDFGDFANYVMQDDILLQTLTVRETI
jgi:ABC-type multidrug transport system ATPase subunit